MQDLMPLAIVGNVNVDLILGPLADWPEHGTEVLVPELVWRVGGSAGHVAVACAELGTGALTVSTVGTDLAGEWLRQQFAPSTVDWIPVPQDTSITTAFHHPSTERSFITCLGHLATLSWDDLHPRVPHARVTLLAGAFLTPALRAQYPAVLSELTSRGSQVALDFGWPAWGFTPDVRAEVHHWLPEVSFLLINEIEALGLTNLPDLIAAVHQLADQIRPDGVVAVKLGAAGVLASQHGRVFRQPAPEVRVIDSVGAGDTWNAAFLHATLDGAHLDQALAYAVHIASNAISTMPRRFSPDPE
ncbi:carbohydrate kinase family protein [Deinococcus deserti]|uniref:Putative ribokinase n=1 Tax=Deinococcus deserti (strain DSM 17065 / CIP 109153 / LMG 22923 / VCD115) TaxID=546414 RepID=C1D226_DEIDV|nr:carbohydrate kinase family protein [Deinococcus deserti]ACO47465.1 putative ribokinase [Deinococcus deserti VCD115]